ncbi:MATE family efflux transporter [Jatrophihabitans lederbergiae]|uniref:MATE family efflux transporter n=1 Tax=Jatrophihabitans lederbergiae TaxID=3075547 RepID=A0ABU2J6V7_9ACTN|nr:MATE family efflux transporter [Jatrophihabitans sp. DSM 44399]MDT0259988.1 MATE family efflux transporter [Jatrophihabitans sp. DSM 44399]
MVTPAEVSTRRIVTLAGSAFVVLAAEPLFLLVDTAVVGHLGRVPLAALGAAGIVMTLLAIVGTSLEYGTTGRAARYFGAGRREAAVNEGVQASWLALLIGLVALVVGEAVAGPVVRVVTGGAGPVADDAERWLRIAILGLPGVLLVLAGNGWLRGVQDTRTPVRIVVLANAVSAVASPVLVYPVGMGLAGSAVANVCAQVLAAALCVRALRAERVPSRPQWHVMRSQVVVSRDLVARSLAFQAAYLTAAGVAARMGAAQLAAHQVGLQLWEFIALLLDSFAIAAQSLVGAALGGGDVEAAKSTAWQVSRYGVVAGVIFAGVAGAGWQLLPKVFSSDAAVQAQAHVLWPWLIAMMPLGGVLFALDGVLLGAGDNAFIRNVTMVAALGAFVPIALLALRLDWGLGGVWAGIASFITVRLIGMAWRTRSGRWLVVGERR